jgi:hypothetical protein
MGALQMFGVKASASLNPPRSIPAVTYSARLSGALSLGLGLVSVLLIQLVPLFLADSLALMLLVGLPLAAAAGYGLVTGLAHLCTRIEVTADGLALTAPTWRLYPTLPLQRLEVGWHELRAVRHRTEHYRVGLPRLGFSIDVYVVETDRGSAVLGGYYLPELEVVLTDIANRGDCGRIEDGAIDLGVLPTLWRGAPGWTFPRHLARE